MRHVVMFSGGVGSWAAAKRVALEHGTQDLVLLFADTLIEDPDLYRFLDEAAQNVGGDFVRISEGRTPWEIFHAERFLGNTRVDPCSKILKRQLTRKWLADHCDPAETIVYLGIDWTEGHRFERAQARWDPWRMAAPMMEKPLLSKTQMLEDLRGCGIRPPRLYDLGFPHNNCGGFCIKAGQAHFRHLLKTLPQVYRHHEDQEERLRQYLEKDVAILRDRRGGKTRPLTLAEFRGWIEAESEQCDLLEWGGCGCFTP